jgi:hypothetical protein
MDLALGHGAPPGDPLPSHLARCGHCREELRRTALLVATARAVRERDVPAAPPERVWWRIVESLAGPEPEPEPRPYAEPGSRPDREPEPRPDYEPEPESRPDPSP